LLFKALAPASRDLVFLCDYRDGLPGADTIVVPARKVYAVLNTFTLRRVSDSAPIDTFSASLSLDVDSWTWGFQATLPADEYDTVKHDADGTPVEVEATINGVAYRFMVESAGYTREFPKRRLSIAGRGIGMALDILALPHANTSARTAAQLMDDALTLNGVGTGWSVDFGLDDWLVPAGAWAYYGTALAAVKTIAEAAGGYVQPHPTNQTLRVLHRYPLAPWAWADATPDIILPVEGVLKEGIDWVEKPRFDRVVVSGASSGVLVQVTRDGMDGSNPAQMVTDGLIQEVPAAMQRGRAILSDTGRVGTISLSLPIFPETGIIPPGKLVRYVDGPDVKIGITRAVQVQVAMPTIRQVVEIEHHA
jgi:hypothetical protein